MNYRRLQGLKGDVEGEFFNVADGTIELFSEMGLFISGKAQYICKSISNLAHCIVQCFKFSKHPA